MPLASTSAANTTASCRRESGNATHFRETSDQRWYNGETVIASIGQGYMLATPLQLASAIGALATRGTRYEPHLVAAVENTLTGERTMYPAKRLADIRLARRTQLGRGD